MTLGATAPAPRKPVPRLVRWLNRLFVAGLLTVAAGELILRLVDRATDHPTGSLYDEIVPHVTRFTMTPGRRVIIPERYGDIEYRFNRLGYRDRDHEIAGPADAHGAARLLVLGDSVSFGLGVAQEEIYPARLERALAAGQGAPADQGVQGVEVINLAIFSYDSSDEAEALAEDGLPFRPRIVLTQFYMNDFAVRPPPSEIPDMSLLQRLRGLRNEILYSSNLYRRFYQLLTMTSFRLFHEKRRLEHPEKLSHLEVDYKLAYLADHPDDQDVEAFRFLAEIARRSRGAGAAPMLLLSPDEVQLFETRYDEINRRVAAFCAREGIPMIDLLPAFRQDLEKHRLFLDGVHFSPRGHALAAEQLRAALAPGGPLASLWQRVPAPPEPSPPKPGMAELGPSGPSP